MRALTSACDYLRKAALSRAVLRFCMRAAVRLVRGTMCKQSAGHCYIYRRPVILYSAAGLSSCTVICR